MKKSKRDLVKKNIKEMQVTLIQQQKKNKMNWHNRYKTMKSGLGLTNSDIAEITGNSADSVKSVTQPNKDIPRWLKLAIVIYERLSEQNN